MSSDKDNQVQTKKKIEEMEKIEEIILDGMHDLLVMTSPKKDSEKVPLPEYKNYENVTLTKEEENEDFEDDLNHAVVAAQKAENVVNNVYQKYMKNNDNKKITEIYYAAIANATINEMKKLEKNNCFFDRLSDDKFDKYFYMAYFNVTNLDLAYSEFHFEAVVHNGYEEEIADFFFIINSIFITNKHVKLRSDYL